MPSSLPRSAWHPTEIRRFVRSVPSGTGVAVVMTDAGEGYLKAIGNPEREHVLACEWVATHLARRLGLPTFDFSLIRVTDVDEIPLPNGGEANSGPAFITRAENGEPWSGKRRQLKQLMNQSDRVQEPASAGGLPAPLGCKWDGQPSPRATRIPI
jgi:hypothetical protein